MRPSLFAASSSGRSRYGGAIAVHNQARKSYRDLVYLDRPRLFEALDALGREYFDMRTSTGLDDAERRTRKHAFDARLSALRLTTGPSATEEGARRYKEDHTLNVRGATLPCEKIRDIGIAFDKQHFLCIYFVWDDEEERVVLKGFEHGETLNDHT